MMPKVRITCFAALFVMLVTGLAYAQTTNPARSRSQYYEARCEDLKSKCGTLFFLENEDVKSIEVSCAYPPSDWKGQPVYADVVITYKCGLEKKGNERVLVCKGYMGLSPSTQATFTPQEFKDAQTRCSKLCPPCPKGWQ